MGRLARINAWLDQPDVRKPRTRRKTIVLGIISGLNTQLGAYARNKRHEELVKRIKALEDRPSEMRLSKKQWDEIAASIAEIYTEKAAELNKPDGV